MFNWFKYYNDLVPTSLQQNYVLQVFMQCHEPAVVLYYRNSKCCV